MTEILQIREDVAVLSAETLAIQAVLLHVLWQLRDSATVPAKIIEEAFDGAIQFTEVFAIQQGGKTAPRHSVKALEIVERLRTLFVDG